MEFKVIKSICKLLLDVKHMGSDKSKKQNKVNDSAPLIFSKIHRSQDKTHTQSTGKTTGKHDCPGDKKHKGEEQCTKRVGKRGGQGAEVSSSKDVSLTDSLA